MRAKTRETDILARDLIRLLNGLTSLHGELVTHMRNKLEAIKRADSDHIQSITNQEMVLASRVGEREGLRRQITRRILDALGLGAEQTGQTKLSSLAQYFTEPISSQLLVAGAALREKLEEADRLRVRSALVTQEMLKHLGEVLAVMRSGGKGVDVYSRSGRRERVGPASVFEAVG